MNVNKVKFTPRTCQKFSEGDCRCSCTLSLNSEPDSNGGERQTPTTLPLERDPEPLYRRLGRAKGRAAGMSKCFASNGIRFPEKLYISKLIVNFL